jgi:hypothetical protein
LWIAGNANFYDGWSYFHCHHYGCRASNHPYYPSTGCI